MSLEIFWKPITETIDFFIIIDIRFIVTLTVVLYTSTVLLIRQFDYNFKEVLIFSALFSISVIYLSCIAIIKFGIAVTL